MDSPDAVSQTSLTAAAARAAHLLVDAPPSIFTDQFAAPLLGDQAEYLVGFHQAHGSHPVLAGARVQVLTRARYTEDRVLAAARRGIDQYVVLGAGLDTFAYRVQPDGPLRVYEVDHPGTQAAKRQRLHNAGIPVPPYVRYVPVDLTSDPLLGALVDAGFDATRPAVIGWLGVTVYLSREAIARTLSVLGGLAPGTELVVDHLVPEPLWDADGRTYVEAVGAHSAERGEPWLTFLGPDEMATLLAQHGLRTLHQAGQRDMIDADLWRRHDALYPSTLSMVTHALVPAG